MNFLLDLHHLGHRATGNETWALETALALHRSLPDDGSIQLFAATTRHAPPGVVSPIPTVPTSVRDVVRLAWDLPRLSHRLAADALLVQYTAPLTATPCVVAVHDLSFCDPRSRDWIRPKERARMRATISVSSRRAHRVVALSDFTAHDLAERWDIDRSRIVVAPPAVSEARVRLLRQSALTDPSRPSSPIATVLAVGNVLPRKNLAMLARAVSAVRQGGIQVRLRIVGQVPAVGQGIMSEIMALPDATEWVQTTGYLSESELVSAYAEASVFCFPSLYEGFGLPVLEAMHAGTPVVASSATAVPEAAGNAALLADPLRIDDWADAITRLLTDQELRSTIVSKGVEHAATFSWRRTAEAVLGALKSVE